MVSSGVPSAKEETLEEQLRRMMLGNVHMGASSQPQQNSPYQNHHNTPAQNPHFATQGYQQGSPSRAPFDQRNQRGRGRGNAGGYGGGRGGGFRGGEPPFRQEGFQQFLAQHGRDPQVSQSAPYSQHPSVGSPRTQRPVDTNSFARGQQQQGAYTQQPQPQHPRQLYNPAARASGPRQAGVHDMRWKYLEDLASQELPKVMMAQAELEAKESFRAALEAILQSVNVDDDGKVAQAISLESFGSLKSTFATAGSDMDLVIVSPSSDPLEQQLSLHESGLPRKLEKGLLNKGYGARLLTRARVPIIKICEKPTPELLQALQEARTKWDDLPDDDKYNLDRSEAGNSKKDTQSGLNGAASKVLEGATGVIPVADPANVITTSAVPEDSATTNADLSLENSRQVDQVTHPTDGASQQPVIETAADGQDAPKKQSERPQRKVWVREKAKGPLDFPKDDIGIQCDINFFNPLGIHNTQMLRCYALCDARVRPMILFIKSWAKKRKINSPYSGTLSSYGYVLMVLHYLMNVARPPVLPNLQLRAEQMGLPPKSIDGWDVQFWADEDAIMRARDAGQLTRNAEPLGLLLKSFFQYFATSAYGFGFVWMADVLSLRTPGGVVSKEQKGWTGAKTETGSNNKEVRHRYLFAVEDPFETEHNVARTVTHNGIVAIRDEFRRAWRILGAVGNGSEPRDGGLFDDLVEEQVGSKQN